MAMPLPSHGDLKDTPGSQLLGQLYQAGATGRLTVEAGPAVHLWFKRGYLCHSEGGDCEPLGELLIGRDRGTARRVRKALALQRADGKLLGQHLLALGLVTPADLTGLLDQQLQRRLRLVFLRSAAEFRFESGMDAFGRVPLSAQLANPLAHAAQALMAMPGAAVEWHEAALAGCRVRLAPERRVPPFLREHDRESVAERLVEWQPSGLLFRSPRTARLASLLLGFGFLEVAPEAPAEGPRIRPDLDAMARAEIAPRADESAGENRVVTETLRLIRAGGTWYELLGVSPLASVREVRARFRALALQVHPDRVPQAQASAAEAVFAEVSRAYHGLIGEVSRMDYDRSLVTRGSWTRLGDARDLERLFGERAAEHLRAGRVHLSQEYLRLAAEMGRTARLLRSAALIQ